MKQITITHPSTNQRHTFGDEAELRKFVNTEIFSFKDSRLFRLQAKIRTATVGQIPEILDEFKIENE